MKEINFNKVSGAGNTNQVYKTDQKKQVSSKETSATPLKADGFDPSGNKVEAKSRAGSEKVDFKNQVAFHKAKATISGGANRPAIAGFGSDAGLAALKGYASGGPGVLGSLQ